MLAAAQNDRQVFAVLSQQFLITFHQLGKPKHRIEWRPEFVAHIGQERALGATGLQGFFFCRQCLLL